ncbi:ssDNA-binding protein [Arenibaculum pallidiluteum]|uniref:ssDNA-binding protein n=1 Tax=Arenibaculum pallidiluteum TaxID=2812559 RepID=UPI001A9679D5|nr:ssDNA-binding protein [Arenibaculum pallidiluteum]
MADRYEYSAKVRTPLFRGAFVRVFEPEDVKNDDGTVSKVWSVTTILEKGADISAIKGAIAEAAKKLWGDKAAAMVGHAKFKNPIKDGREMANREGELYAGFEPGQITFKLSTKQRRPGLVDKLVRPIVDADGKTLVDEKNEVYEVIPSNAVHSGCYFYATLCAQAFDRSDGFGVSLKLENLQLVKPGERLGGGGAASAKDDFAPVEGTAGGDLADLLS